MSSLYAHRMLHKLTLKQITINLHVDNDTFLSLDSQLPHWKNWIHPYIGVFLHFSSRNAFMTGYFPFHTGLQVQ